MTKRSLQHFNALQSNFSAIDTCSHSFWYQGLSLLQNKQPRKMAPVWLFVPNLIGYFRILTGLWAFGAARDPSRWAEFFCCYAVSYGLDAVDGVAARKLKQTSRLGAVLDMITDRFCTAALLGLLAHLYPVYHWVFTYLMILDIVSHWAQMYRLV